MEQHINYWGTVRVKQFGTDSASRRARKKGQIEKALKLEAKALKRHNEMLKEGFIYAKGCHRFRKSICTCHKCTKHIPQCTTHVV